MTDFDITGLDEMRTYGRDRVATYNGDADRAVDRTHIGKLGLENGTISLSFTANQLFGDYALISKDAMGNNEGDFTVWMSNGVVRVSFQDGEGHTEWLSIPQVLNQGETYQFAMSFGEDGLSLWLNGQMMAAEPEFTTDLTANTNTLVIGGSRSGRNDQTDDAHSLFEGQIGNVAIYDAALTGPDMIALAGAVDPALGHAAAHHAAMSDIMPTFDQLHHGSETLQEMLMPFGVGEHGHATVEYDMWTGGRGGDSKIGSSAADALNGGLGGDTLKGKGGNDLVQGGSGNDVLMGGAGNDILDGGEGEDQLNGGDGDDILISRADAREPTPTYIAGRDEADPFGDLTNGQVYPDQPVPGSDALTGGAGADIFYFQTLINAKDYIIKLHTRDDGTINWHGVAGENDNLHDHWVDALGHDIVMDYSRADGDRIVVEGHTTEIREITYGDADGNGVMDHSVIHLYSDQGNGGGAHHLDELGSITVYGDLVRLSDVEHTAAPAYGIVATIEDLDNAVKPTQTSADITHAGPSDLPDAQQSSGGRAPVVSAYGTFAFDREERAPLVLAHTDEMDVRNGTISMSFRADALVDHQFLFTKDASGDGLGHLAAFIDADGDLTVRIQDNDRSHYYTVDNVVKIGETYDFAVNFGKGGLEIWLDGVRVAYDVDHRMGLNWNEEALIIGANGWNNTPGEVNSINSHFTGEIKDIVLYDRKLDGEDLYGDLARDNTLDTNASSYKFDVVADNNGGLSVTGDGPSQSLDGFDYLAFNDVTIRTNDIQFGSAGNDTLDGGTGADWINGRGSADLIRGHGNDDVLIGGRGADSLYGGEGQDKIYGSTHDDYIDGGAQRDMIYGDAGNDTLSGGAGNDRFYGGIGDDVMYGNSWSSAALGKWDRAYFDGDFADYAFETTSYWNGSRGETVTQLIVTDDASGGSDGYYEGRDRLVDIELLVFSDQIVNVDDIL